MGEPSTRRPIEEAQKQFLEVRSQYHDPLEGGHVAVRDILSRLTPNMHSTDPELHAGMCSKKVYYALHCTDLAAGRKNDEKVTNLPRLSGLVERFGRCAEICDVDRSIDVPSNPLYEVVVQQSCEQNATASSASHCQRATHRSTYYGFPYR